MLEYIGYKKYKKHKQGKTEEENAKAELKEEAASGSSSKPALPTQVKDKPDDKPADKPILDDDDESFFDRLTSGRATVDEMEQEGEKPPLPPRMKTPDLSWDSDTESFVPKLEKEKGKDKRPADTSRKDSGKGAAAIGRRISLLVRRPKKDVKPTNLAVPDAEADKEKDDLSRVLDDLNISAKNNRAFSLSDESAELVRRFTLVLKDLVNGVPTAVDDLKALLDDHDGLLAKNYEKLPGSMKKLVTTLPTKLTSTLAPELLAVAAESQGLKHEDNSKDGVKSTAKSLLMPKNLSELVTKPSAIVGMLKAIMNALKLRWPAFMGTNVIWSIGLFLLMFVLWYCHKRGREVRLEGERSAAAADAARFEELPDDPTLLMSSSTRDTPVRMESDGGTTSPRNELPPPPMGRGASGRENPAIEK